MATDRRAVNSGPDPASNPNEAMWRAILDGTVHGWAPVVRSGSGWMLVNLAHVVRVETGPEDASHLGFG